MKPEGGGGMKRRNIPWCSVLILFILTALPAGVCAQGGAPLATPQQIDQMTAPVALYPDSLLSQILMASTYPLEIVEADRWSKANQGLKGKQLDDAVERQDWDPSVKSLVYFPQVLDMMSQKLDWTSKLGDAFLGQEQDVMDSIQRLRKQAKAQGNLKSTKEQKIVVQQDVISVEPTDPQVIYVPVYNPTVVYGAWAYPAYPPAVLYPPGYIAAPGFVSFTAGFFAGAYLYGGFNWGTHNVIINNNHFYNRNVWNNRRGPYPGPPHGHYWNHDPYHRQNVPYRNANASQRYGQGQANARRDAVRTNPSTLNNRGYDAARSNQPRSAMNVDKGQSRQNQAFGGLDNGRRDQVAGQRGQASRNSSNYQRQVLQQPSGGQGSRGGFGGQSFQGGGAGGQGVRGGGGMGGGGQSFRGGGGMGGGGLHGGGGGGGRRR